VTRLAALAALAVPASSHVVAGCADGQGDRGSGEVTTWRVDHSAPEPSPSDRTIAVLVDEVACNAGEPPEPDRIQPPDVVYAEDAVTVTYVVEPPEGARTCLASPPARLDLELNQPLADRVLLDGGEAIGNRSGRLRNSRLDEKRCC